MVRERVTVVLRLVAALLAAVVLPSCGTTISCTRHADGSIECSVGVHQDGNHDQPVK